MSTQSIQYRPVNPVLRAQVAQSEMYRQHPRSDYPDRIWGTVDRLASDTLSKIAQGHPRSAEYWLLQMERAAGILTREQLDTRVRSLGRFSLGFD